VDKRGDNSISRNSQVQLKSVHLLSALTFDLCHILADSPKGFPSYLVDILHKYKVIKTCVFHLQSLMEERAERLLGLGEDNRSCLYYTDTGVVCTILLQELSVLCCYRGTA